MQRLRSDIERIFSAADPLTANDRNDIRVVLGAAYYDCILITNDGNSKSQPLGILGRTAELERIKVRVMTAQQAVLKVRQLIIHRDALVLQSIQAGAPKPDWYQKD